MDLCSVFLRVRFRIRTYYASKRETLFKSQKPLLNYLEELCMKGKKAVITVDLVDESLQNPNKKIVQEITRWFKEDAVSAPWIKEIKGVRVQED